MFPSYLEVGKNWFLAISSLTNTVAAIWREIKNPAILRQKKVVHNCSQEKDYAIQERKKCFPAIRKKCSQLFRASHLLGATVTSKEKDYDIYLKSEKASRSTKKMFPSYLEVETSSCYFEPDKHYCSLLDRKKWIVHNCQDQGKRL